MNLWNWLRSRRIRFRERHNRESELDREMEAHLELEAEEQKESGLQPEEAHYAARRAFGNKTMVQRGRARSLECGLGWNDLPAM